MAQLGAEICQQGVPRLQGLALEKFFCEAELLWLVDPLLNCLQHDPEVLAARLNLLHLAFFEQTGHVLPIEVS